MTLRVAAGELVAGFGGAIGVALLAGLLGMILLRRWRRKQQGAAQEAGVVSDYSGFKDGMDADEMEASGVPSGSFRFLTAVKAHV